MNSALVASDLTLGLVCWALPNFCFFLLTSTKKETEQETNDSSSIESLRFRPFSFEEPQKRFLLRRNCTEVVLIGLCGPSTYNLWFLVGFLVIWIIKNREVLGRLRRGGIETVLRFDFTYKYISCNELLILLLCVWAIF